MVGHVKLNYSIKETGNLSLACLCAAHTHTHTHTHKLTHHKLSHYRFIFKSMFGPPTVLEGSVLWNDCVFNEALHTSSRTHVHACIPVHTHYRHHAPTQYSLKDADVWVTADKYRRCIHRPDTQSLNHKSWPRLGTREQYTQSDSHAHICTACSE